MADWAVSPPHIASVSWSRIAAQITTAVQALVNEHPTKQTGERRGAVIRYREGPAQLRLRIRAESSGAYVYLYKGEGNISAGAGIVHTWSIYWTSDRPEPHIAGTPCSDETDCSWSDFSLNPRLVPELVTELNATRPDLVANIAEVITWHLAN